jgi:lsr operon transcriptional repressor
VDADGQPVDLEINERIIGLTLEQIARIPRVIGVAGGAAKREIVLAALRAGILDVLVTDQATAESLLEDAA